MVYRFLHFVATTIFKIFYRKIEYYGLENIPQDKPVFVACNHPGGFIEPCILAVVSKYPFYFLVRGDLFAKQPMRWLLEQTNQIPIFRKKDGMNNMKKNQGSFTYVNKMLSENKSIMIFSEGSTEDMKYLRPLQKGLARMAHNAMDQGLDVHIVPVGITYTKQEKMRTEVFCKVGKPIRAMNYKESLDANLNEGIKELYHDLSHAMRMNMVQVDDAEDLELLDYVLRLTREENPDSRFPLWEESTRKLDLEKSISTHLNEMPRDRKKELLKDLKSLEAEKLEYGILPEYYNKELSNLSYIFIGVLGFVPAVLGFIFNYIPAKINLIINENLVKKKIYRTSILFAGSSVFFPLYYLIMSLIGVLTIGYWTWGILIFALLGYWYFLYTEWMHSFKINRNYQSLTEGQKGQLKKTRILIKEKYNV